MKKMTLKMRLLGGLVIVSMALAAGSCAQGADCDEVFESTVRNTQMVSPAADDVKLEVVNVEYMKVSWPVVKGAGGYQCLVQNINDEANPVTVVDDVMDDSSFEFKLSDDTRYAISIQTLGNEKLNNKDATTTTEKVYFFGVEGMLVPASAGDIGAHIAGVIAEQADAWAAARAEDPNFEIAFDLEPGGQYTMDTEFDAGLQSIRIRTLTPDNRATVNVTKSFKFKAGLRLENLNLDCSSFTTKGLVCVGNDLGDELLVDHYGFVREGSLITGFYYINKLVIFNNCWIKNLQNSLIYDNNQVAIALNDFRVINSIVQMNYESSNALIHFKDKGRVIKNLTIENSTFYNLMENGSAYFIRYNNSSNSTPSKCFGAGATCDHIINNSTFIRTFTGKDFANNFQNTGELHISVTNSVFYDVYRLYQYLQSNVTTYTKNNTMWYVVTSPQSHDTGGRNDKLGNPFTTLEDPGFTAPMTALDFSQPNGGLNLKPTGAISSNGGDPRWRN